MELNRHICTQLIEKAKSFSQITLDDDYIVRDNKPDVVRVIYSRGDIWVEDVKAGNQGLWITGKLRFSTLYQSDDENHRLESVNGEVPFQEKVMMDEVEEEDDVVVDMTIEDLSVGIINSRKLVVRAVVNVTARNLEEEDEEIACGILDEGYDVGIPNSGGESFDIVCEDDYTLGVYINRIGIVTHFYVWVDGDKYWFNYSKKYDELFRDHREYGYEIFDIYELTAELRNEIKKLIRKFYC
mgnify:CR=1 FL=1